MKLKSKLKAGILASFLAISQHSYSQLMSNTPLSQDTKSYQIPSNSIYFSHSLINNLPNTNRDLNKIRYELGPSDIELDKNKYKLKQKPERRQDLTGKIEIEMDRLEEFKFGVDENIAPTINNLLYESGTKLKASGDISNLKIGQIDYEPLKLTISLANNQNRLFSISHKIEFENQKEIFNGIEGFIEYSTKSIYNLPSYFLNLFQNKK